MVHPKRKSHLPTINFQGAMWVLGRVFSLSRNILSQGPGHFWFVFVSMQLLLNSLTGSIKDLNRWLKFPRFIVYTNLRAVHEAFNFWLQDVGCLVWDALVTQDSFLRKKLVASHVIYVSKSTRKLGLGRWWQRRCCWPCLSIPYWWVWSFIS